jgi:hypothetical protein
MKKVLVTILLTVGMISAVFAGGGGEEPLFVPEKGTIHYLEGDVTVDREPAEIGQIVGLGSAIETGSGSMCEIVFGEDNVFRLLENTLAVFSLNEATLELQRGSLGAVFNKLTGLDAEGPGNFRVQSPQVVGGVRGTAFFIKALDEVTTYLCTCFGEIEQRGVGSKTSRTVSSGHHAAFTYTVTENGIRTQKADILYHDDELMDSIAATVGADIPWDYSGSRDDDSDDSGDGGY